MEASELQQERQHLKATEAVIQAQLDQAARESAGYAAAIRAVQQEQKEHAQMDIGGLYSAQGFGDLLERSQDAQVLTQMSAAQEELGHAARTLLRMREHPYFARIDFRFADGETEPVYIGRATLLEEETMRVHVYDWRVPIASVFYQYGVGPAQYEAPAGTISGEVLLKRQYEIRHGELLYYFDANTEVQDQFLRELLARPAAPAMKSIVETIQRDQDSIIRDMKADLLMVQGAAGSGKTSVALHRVAYLMYQGLRKGRLSPGDILILAPNATFERYISQVLPDLGEKQVQTLLSEDLLASLLPGVAIEPRSAWVERLLTAPSPAQRRDLRALRELKGGKAFVGLLDRLVYELPRQWIPFCDVDYDGQHVADAALSRASLCNAAKKAPLGIRLRMLEKSIWARIHALRPARYAKLLAFAGQYPAHATEVQAFARMLSIRESGRLMQRIRAFTRVDCVSLYRALLENQRAFARLAAGLLPAREIEPLRLATLAQWADGGIPYQDAVAIAYLSARVNGCRTYHSLRQVVVDEAQDLDVLHAALLGLLFPHARFTMLGDVHQTLDAPADMSRYDAIRGTLGKAHSLLVRLDKSFRCTREIWDFSTQFLPPGAAGQCFSRHGEKPAIFSAKDDAAMDALLLSQARQCRRDGCRSVALLCKTERDAAAHYERLKGAEEVVLVGAEEVIQAGRLSILSLYMAKGLEFDAVLLLDVDAAHYREEADRGLLYIGCTRALHVLRLFHTGEISPLLRVDAEVRA